MTTCPHTSRVQDYLDDDLGPVETLAFRAHLQECEACSAELAVYASLFASLASTPLFDPGPALTERVLDRVLPSRLRRRLVTVVGWSYTALSAVSTYLFITWISRHETQVWLGTRLGEAYVRLAQAAWFVIHSVALSGLRVLDGWVTLEATATRLAPLARAFALLLSHPTLVALLSAASLTTAALLWWMRPRRVIEGVRSVLFLG